MYFHHYYDFSGLRLSRVIKTLNHKQPCSWVCILNFHPVLLYYFLKALASRRSDRELCLFNQKLPPGHDVVSLSASANHRLEQMLVEHPVTCFLQYRP